MEEKNQKPEIPILKCSGGNPAKFLCSSSNCQAYGLVCFVQQCQCRNNHEMCLFSQMQIIIRELVNSKINIPQHSTKSFTAIEKILEDMIQELSKIRDEVYLAKQNFGLRQNQQELFGKIMKQDCQKINGKLAQKVLKEFQKGKKNEIMTQKQIQVSWKIYEGYFNNVCQELRKYFKINNVYKCIVQNPSKITSQFAQLQQWIIPSFGKQIKEFRLLYRGSEQGFQATKFHQKCDTSNNVLVLIQTNTERIIGGFIPKPWNSATHGAYFFDNTNRTFIFSLTLKKKMLNTSGNNSIFNYNTYGPTFGAHDIYISNQSDKNNCSSSFPTSYNNGTYQSNGQQSRMAFVGSKDGVFKTVQYEVYQVL